jgi:hypothetical protein
MTPMIDPMTIPAIAPPERPCLEPLVVDGAAAAEVADELAEVVEDDDDEVNSGGMVVAVGNAIPTHLVPESDCSQHESVAFGELLAQ